MFSFFFFFKFQFNTSMSVSSTSRLKETESFTPHRLDGKTQCLRRVINCWHNSNQVLFTGCVSWMWIGSKLLRKYDRSCHKNLIPHWCSHLSWRCLALPSLAVVFHLAFEEKRRSLISVCRIVQRHASFPSKVNDMLWGFAVFWCAVIEAPYTVPWDGFVMHLIIYILLGRLSAKGPRGICWVN